MPLKIIRKEIEAEREVGHRYLQVLSRAEALVPGAGREAIGETFDNNGENGTIGIDRISIPHSLGTKSTNYRILLPDGSYTTFTDGTRITNIKIIAGNGRDRQIDEIDNLLERFGGNAFEWQKKKDIAFIDFYGESIRTEVHGYEEPDVGGVIFKLERLLEE